MSKELYRVRKSWEDAKSQVGAFANLANAIKVCNDHGSDYKVYSSKGTQMYPAPEVSKPAVAETANPADMWSFFKAQGLTDCGIAGLMGNLQLESGLKPNNVQNSYESSLGMTDEEYTLAVDNGTYTNFVNDAVGYGLAQWTFWSLKQSLLNYCKERNKSIGDLQTQLDFLVYQLSNQYKPVWNVLKRATTIREAANCVLVQFERPADQSESALQKRINAGEKFYNDYAKKEGQIISNMKYSDKNKPLLCLQMDSTCFKNTSPMIVKGVLWHSTGANNPTIKRYVQPSDDAPDRQEMLNIIGVNQYGNDWNHIYLEAGLNAFIGKLADGTVATVQTMPWDWAPWGCGVAYKNGPSCNSHWIQFEICEDGLNDENYFNEVYKEACELTAYLCDMFNIDPYGTVEFAGKTVPTILCHKDSHTLGLGCNHSDVMHWFPKFGKSMETARADVAKLLETRRVVAEPAPAPVEPEPTPVTPAPAELYRVRKMWSDAKSQLGAFKSLENAKEVAIAHPGYRVYDSDGDCVYPETGLTQDDVEFKIGDTVMLLPGATYASGTKIPDWVMKSVLYVRLIKKNGNVMFSVKPTGPYTGLVKATDLEAYVIESNGNVSPKEEKEEFKPYLVKITADSLNVRAGAGTQFKINTVVKKSQVYTITAEKNGYGRLKSGAGWIALEYTRKLGL